MELGPKDKVLVVEDVTTTGGSALKVVNLVKDLGAEAIGVGAIVDRSGLTLDFGVPFFKLLTLTLNTYMASRMPDVQGVVLSPSNLAAVNAENIRITRCAFAREPVASSWIRNRAAAASSL